MNLNDIIKDWDDIVNNSSIEIEAAESYARDLYEVAETEQEKKDAQELIDLVQKRLHNIDIGKDKLKKKIIEFALMLHHYKGSDV